MACKNETPKLKDQVIKPYGPKRQGQIKTHNLFDPLTKFDLFALSDTIMDTMNKTAHSKEERRVARTPAWTNVAWLYMLKIMETSGLWTVGAPDT